MSVLEIVLLIMGIVIFIGSFLIPEGKTRSGEDKMVIDENKIHDLVAKEVEEAQGKITDIVDETITYAMEKTERSMDRLTNEKMMAVNEYSDTVLSEINKNHQEVVFLYDMLNEKAKEVKNTVKDVNNVKKEVDKAVSESAAAIENNTAEYAYAEEVKKEEKQSPEVKILSQNDELKKQAETKNKSADKADLDIENANSKNQKILKFYKEGLDNRTIATQLGRGVGEVKLVVDLYKTSLG